jgi:hypothetical protein
VLHDEELTFAVATSLPGPWRLRPRGFADVVAEALAAALRDAGLEAERAAASTGEASRPGAHPCFARTAAGEVRVGRFKVAGIASRFTRGAALSHASVPLTGAFRDVARFRIDLPGARDAMGAGARGASELLDAPVDGDRMGARLAEALAEALGSNARGVGFEGLGLVDPRGTPASPAREAFFRPSAREGACRARAPDGAGFRSPPTDGGLPSTRCPAMRISSSRRAK